MQEKEGSASLAATAPVVLGLIAIGALPLLAGGVNQLGDMLMEGGFGSLLACVSFIPALIGAAVLGGLGARRGDLLFAIAAAVVLLPWIAGSLGAYAGHQMVWEAIAYADPSQKLRMFLVGSSEAMSPRAIGGILSGLLLIGVALSTFLGRPGAWAVGLTALGLGVVAGGSGMIALSLSSGLGALGRAAPDMMMTLVAKALDRTIFFSSVHLVGAALSLVALGLAVFVAATKQRSIGAVLLLGGAGLFAGALDQAMTMRVLGDAERIEQAAWFNSAPGFSPTVLPAGGFGSAEGLVTAKGLQRLDGTAVHFETPSDLEALSRQGVLEVAFDRTVSAGRVSALAEAAARVSSIEELRLIGRPRPVDPMLLAPFGRWSLLASLSRSDSHFVRVRLRTDRHVQARCRIDGETVEIEDPEGAPVPVKDHGDVEEAAKLCIADPISGTAGTLGAAVLAINRTGYLPLFSFAQNELPPEEAAPEEPLPVGKKGFLEKRVIRQVIRRNIPRVKYCYEKQLVRNPDIFGKLVVKFTIGLDGRVGSAKAKDDTLESPEVTRCILKAVRSLRFPKPEGGIVVVSYPFVFKSQ